MGALPAVSGETDRIECFRLGARLHDHVSDMLHAIEEVDESKAGADPIGDDARQWYRDLERRIGQEVADALRRECLPNDVADLYREVLDHAARPPAVGQNNAAGRDALYALAVKLGDPPLLRNLRRVQSARRARLEPK